MNADQANHIPSYSSVYAIGHRAVAEVFCGLVIIEEKIDGSQFSMCRQGGQLLCRSKGQQLVVDAPEKMFAAAVESAKALDLHDGWVYRCEYLAKPKHNTLAYARIPKGHLIAYDIMTAPETFLSHPDKAAESARIGLECVPLLFAGIVTSIEQIRALLDRESVLGGCKIEGAVVKNYGVFTPEKKIAVAKLVSDDFKEKHQHEWKQSNPTQSDIVQHLIAELRTEARWRKAVQHLRDAGKLTESLQDIGTVIREIQADTAKEEADAVKDVLFKHFWPKIQRGIVAGAAEWYKDQVSVNPFPAKPSQ